MSPASGRAMFLQRPRMEDRPMKRNPYLLLACCAALLAIAEPACSQATEPAGAHAGTLMDPGLQRAQKAWHEAASEATKNHLRTVAARGDARSLLAAAMLWPQGPDEAGDAKVPAIAPEQRAWFETARGKRPRDPLVAWIEAGGCSGLSDSCYRDRALEFLLQAEPENAAVHLLALGAAQRLGKQDEAEAHWQGAALATNYDARTLEISRLLYSVMSDVSTPPLAPALAQSMGESLGMGRAATPEESRDVSTMAVWAAVALPAYQTLTRGCNADALEAAPRRRAECDRVMTLLAADDSILISPSIGLRMLVELAGDEAKRAVRRERLRQFQWVYENAQRSMVSGDMPTAYLRWVMQDGELPAMRRLLQTRGIAPAAPAGWLPERADIRALLEPAAAEI